LGASTGTIVSADVMNSTSYPITQGSSINATFSHGLSAAPAYLRAVLLCTTADTASGLAIGDEVQINNFIPASTPMTYQELPTCPFSAGANASVIYVNYNGYNSPTLVRVTWLGAYKTLTSLSHFSIKIYWQ
jgi:hypothetical protein